MLDIKKMKDEQLKLAKKIILKDSYQEINLIGGVDQAYYEDKVISVIVVMKYPSFEMLEKKSTISEPKIPYVPGFLSYRESPVILETWSKVEIKPDLLMVDGNGILHHRGIGLASHLGLLLDIPTIGISKKLLLGDEKGEKIVLNDKPVAYIRQTKKFAKPIYISPGHKISLKSAGTITEMCLKGQNKLPEPLRIAHKIAGKIKNKIKDGD